MAPSLTRAAAAAAALAAAVHAQRAPPVPPSQGAVVTGKWRNMFVEAGYDAKDVDAKINATFTQLFYGDPTYQAIYWEVPSENTAYVSDVKNHDVRTEGMGYAMMALVQLNYQEQFDRVWGWVQKHMYHGSFSDPLYGWSAWHCRTDGTIIDPGPAPDGETFMVTALYFAANRWGDASGRWNYTAAADAVLWAVQSKEDPPCGPHGCSGAVNMFDPKYKVGAAASSGVRGNRGCSASLCLGDAAPRRRLLPFACPSCPNADRALRAQLWPVH